MALRIDPACPDLRQLQSAHAREFRRMVDDPTTKLALILRERHDREVTAHAQACFRCEHHLPPCKGCGRDLRQRAHGWMCSEKPGRWGDLLPWRWFGRDVPAEPLPAASAPEAAPEPEPEPEPEPVAPPAPTPPPARQAPPPPPRPEPVKAAPKPPPKKAAPPPPPPPPPKKPKAPEKPDAYAALGLAPDASWSDVRKAFREKAQQYHPDKVGHLAPEFRVVAEQRMKEINEAYQALQAKHKAEEKAASSSSSS